MGVRRLAVRPPVDVCLHHSAGVVDVIAVKAGAMIDVFPDYAETPDRRAVTFASAGDARSRGPMFTTIKIGLLLAEIDHDRGASGIPFRHVRRDEIGDGVISAATAEGQCEQGERRE